MVRNEKMSEWKIFFKSFSILDPTNRLIISFTLPTLLVFIPCMKNKPVSKLMKLSVLDSVIASRTVDVHCSLPHRGRVVIFYYSPVLVLTGRRLKAYIFQKLLILEQRRILRMITEMKGESMLNTDSFVRPKIHAWKQNSKIRLLSRQRWWKFNCEMRKKFICVSIIIDLALAHSDSFHTPVDLAFLAGCDSTADCAFRLAKDRSVSHHGLAVECFLQHLQDSAKTTN